MEAVTVEALGPLRVVVGDIEVRLRPAERAVLAALTLHRPRPVRAEALVELLWPDPPPSARKSLQNHVARLRRALGPGAVVSVPAGYALGDGVRTDLDDVAGRPLDGARSPELAARLGRWRGVAFSELDGAEAEVERTRLDELRRATASALADALLREGRYDAATGLLEQLVSDDPYDERSAALLADSLGRAGRRRDGLRAVHQARQRLADVGLEVGATLARVEQALLDGGPDAEAADGAGPEGDFVGRVDERALLRAALDGGRGAPSPLLVIGPPGVGKTALVRTVCEERPGTTVLWGRCDPAPGIPLAPFVEAVEALADVDRAAVCSGLARSPALRRLSPVLATLAGDVAPEAGAAFVGPGSLAEAVVHVLAEAAARRPVALVLDDVHLAPPATRDVLARLVGDAPAVTVLATARHLPSGFEAMGATLVELGPLTPADVAAHLRTLAPGADAAAALVLAWTGGNALHVREAVRALVGDGWLRHEPDGSMRFDAQAAPSPSLRDLLDARLRRLSPSTVAALRVAAVVGPRFDLRLVATAVGAPVDDDLAGATRAGIVRPDDAAGSRGAFTHDLLHDAVLATVADGERLELSAVLADAAERLGAPAGVVAHHRHAARTLDPVAAVHALRRAAEADTDAYAHLEAAERYAVAADLARELGDARTACELGVLEGGSRRQAGDARSVPVLLAAADEARALGDGDLLGRCALALCHLGPTSSSGLTDARAASLADEALAVTTDPVLRAEVAAAATQVHAMGEHPERARELFDQAEAVARRLDDPLLLAAVLPAAYLSLGDPDHLERRRRIGEELVDRGRAGGAPMTEWEGLHLRYSTQLQLGDPGLRATHLALRALADRLKEPARHWETDYIGAATLHLDGDLDGAEACAEDVLLRLGDVVAPSRSLAIHGVQVLAVRLDQGRLAELADLLAALVRDQPAVTGWRAALAAALAEGGELDAARRLLDPLAADGLRGIAHDFTRSAVVALVAATAAATGHGPAATAAVATLAPWTGRMTWAGSCTLGPVDLYLGLALASLGHRTEALHHLDEAASLATRLRAPALTARTARHRTALTHPD